jgi:F-type H+-transporting ATPase subunit beta
METNSNIGKVTRIRGSVVDVFFQNDLPAINTLLLTGTDNEKKIEVYTQLDDNHLRGISLNPTQGLARGMNVTSTGKELSVPLGKNILGRMFDVFGNPIDHQEPPKDVQWKSIHQSPPPLSKRSIKSEVFIRVLKP